MCHVQPDIDESDLSESMVVVPIDRLAIYLYFTFLPGIDLCCRSLSYKADTIIMSLDNGAL